MTERIVAGGLFTHEFNGSLSNAWGNANDLNVLPNSALTETPTPSSEDWLI